MEAEDLIKIRAIRLGPGNSVVHVEDALAAIKIAREEEQTKQIGWKCPVCGSVYAPHVSTCIRCDNFLRINRQQS